MGGVMGMFDTGSFVAREDYEILEALIEKVRALPQQWLDEANAMPGNIPEQIMGAQMRIDADELRKIVGMADSSAPTRATTGSDHE
jgi:hypothetical protein